MMKVKKSSASLDILYNLIDANLNASVPHKQDALIRKANIFYFLIHVT